MRPHHQIKRVNVSVCRPNPRVQIHDVYAMYSILPQAPNHMFRQKKKGKTAGLPEWSKGEDLRSSARRVRVGSNPTASSISFLFIISFYVVVYYSSNKTCITMLLHTSTYIRQSPVIARDTTTTHNRRHFGAQIASNLTTWLFNCKNNQYKIAASRKQAGNQSITLTSQIVTVTNLR